MKIISMILENISVWILGQRERRGGECVHGVDQVDVGSWGNY